MLRSADGYYKSNQASAIRQSRTVLGHAEAPRYRQLPQDGRNTDRYYADLRLQPKPEPEPPLPPPVDIRQAAAAPEVEPFEPPAAELPPATPPDAVLPPEPEPEAAPEPEPEPEPEAAPEPEPEPEPEAEGAEDAPDAGD